MLEPLPRRELCADGALRAGSPGLMPGQVSSFRVDITGVKEIIPRVLNGGDGYNCGHAAWGLARFIKADSTDPLPGEVERAQTRP
jgi:hypothetical protein